MISDNIKNIKERINSARLKSDKNEDVTLVAVTKTRSVEEIMQVIESGVKDLGENRVQEFMEKYEHLPDNVRWHIIGTLQSNKVKYIIDKVYMIHSVDRNSLIDEIDRQAKLKGVKMNILIQVNVAREPQKHGYEVSEVEEAIKYAATKENIIVRGIMMMAPAGEKEEVLLELFEKTRNIYEEMMKFSAVYDNINIDTLSMGMTDDFEYAVQSGSNAVRIGRALFV